MSRRKIARGEHQVGIVVSVTTTTGGSATITIANTDVSNDSVNGISPNNFYTYQDNRIDFNSPDTTGSVLLPKSVQ